VNKEYILKLIAVIGALFVAFLWSGGIWEHRVVGDENVRINKITGTMYKLTRRGEWLSLDDIAKQIRIEEAEAAANPLPEAAK